MSEKGEKRFDVWVTFVSFVVFLSFASRRHWSSDSRKKGKTHATPVYTHFCVGVKETRNLLQIAKCDKEIQLIRIRCRHMWLQLHVQSLFFCFLQATRFAYHRLTSMAQKRQLKWNHMLCRRRLVAAPSEIFSTQTSSTENSFRCCTHEKKS